jgi:PAT family beta-lactamase induction signal transducer AmpG
MLGTITTAQQIISTISRSRRHFIILLLGFSSGLPAALTASTLQAWFTEAGMSLSMIGAITLLALPYSFRFLWAPLFDSIHIPGFDRRRGWLLITQVGLIMAITAMALITPAQTFEFSYWHIPWLMVLGFIVAFLSTSQDVLITAYQIEIFPKEEQALSASVYVTGWRVGAVISGAIALILVKALEWKGTYLLMASLMALGVLATLIGPVSPYVASNSKAFFKTAISSLKEFFQRYKFKTALIFLFLIATYKAGDALTLALNTTFLLRKMGFDLATVGLVNKTVSIIAGLLGSLTAGILMTRISLYRALLLFGVIQSVATLSYVIMAYFGKSLFLLVFTALTENFCSGMGSIALIALIMTLCDIRYTATQFALLSGLAFIARFVVGPIAAIMVEAMGWLQFFIACFILSFPTLIFVYANKQAILQLKKHPRKLHEN